MSNNDISEQQVFNTFKEFYPFYLSQHANLTCRRLHFVGSTMVLILIGLSLFLQNAWLLIGLPIAGYSCAWVGHFIFEKNRPATFTYPLYSLLGDWVMFWQIIVGKVSIR